MDHSDLSVQRTFTLDDDDVLAQAFEQSHRAAEQLVHHLTPTEVLGEFLPTTQLKRESTVSSRLSSGTPPTSMSIHETAGQVSDDATRGSTNFDALLWGMDAFSSSSGAPHVRRSKVARSHGSFLAPAYRELPTWLQISLLVAGTACLTLCAYCLHSILQSMTTSSDNILRPDSMHSPSFEFAYFRNLPPNCAWRRHLMFINGCLWLYSLSHVIKSFRRMLSGSVSNHFMQTELLKATFLWLACSGLDGVLRLRTREEISVSMMTILMLMLVLSTFARNLAT